MYQPKEGEGGKPDFDEKYQGWVAAWGLPFLLGPGPKNKAGPGKDPFIAYEFGIFFCIFSKFLGWKLTIRSRILKF